MTEYWKSHAMHWCDLCRCWLNDTKAAKLNHERGAKHQENLARKLRDMNKKAAAEKKDADTAAATMDSIEKAAREQYEADQRAAEEQAGKWMWSESAGYYYNPTHRWYYDYKTKWYYGGDPLEWTQTPALPSAALFGRAPHEGGDAPQPGSAAAAAAAAAAGSSGGGAAGAGGGTKVAVRRTVVSLPAHPQAMTGGHQMPVAGRIGGAKGVGSSSEPAAAGVDAAKRKREQQAAGGKPGKPGKPVDPAEAAALARREAARQRVEARTKAAFGLT